MFERNLTHMDVLIFKQTTNFLIKSPANTLMYKKKNI